MEVLQSRYLSHGHIACSAFGCLHSSFVGQSFVTKRALNKTFLAWHSIDWSTCTIFTPSE